MDSTEPNVSCTGPKAGSSACLSMKQHCQHDLVVCKYYSVRFADGQLGQRQEAAKYSTRCQGCLQSYIQHLSFLKDTFVAQDSVSDVYINPTNKTRLLWKLNQLLNGNLPGTNVHSSQHLCIYILHLKSTPFSKEP